MSQFNRQTKQTQPGVMMRHFPSGVVLEVGKRTSDGVVINQPTFRQGNGSNGRFTGIHINGPKAGLQPKQHFPIEELEVIAESFEDYQAGRLLPTPLRWDLSAMIWR